ncbi:tetratricopeptide repeat protein [Rhodopseudomonas telluris]|uniref:Tetratricopeptide repeat protein n=1 Tax=Rhodopseudomonas telluris TaxID=644215 RepID=A0ABV6EZH7_9BRAD
MHRVLDSRGVPHLSGGLDSAPVPAHEQYLSDQLDRLRDNAKSSDPKSNLQVFQSFLDSLPNDASPIIRFRAKANIGIQHLEQGDAEQAVKWLLEAYEEAPEDRRAIANRALALWLGGDAEEAYKFGRERLAADPENDTLASYLPQIAASVPSVTDGLDGIPDALRDKEPMAVAEAVFLRARNQCPAWWNWTRSALERYPESKHLQVMAAASYVEEILRDETAQRTQIYRDDQREQLRNAAEVLDADWQAKPWRLKSRLDDAPQTLANAMIAYRLLHDREKAVALAERIADEAITYADIVRNAVMIAMSFDQMKLASRLISLMPDDPELAFHAGIIAVGNNEWGRAADLFKKGAIPDVEKGVVEIAIALAPIMESGRPVDGSAIDSSPIAILIEGNRDNPRGLTLIAQVAKHLGLDDLSKVAFEAAVGAVQNDSHIATRLMLASFAEKSQAPTCVIDLLDGHLPPEGFERDYERLAVAHANEHPHRQRNIAFFDKLPPKLRNIDTIKQAHASVLVDVGRLPEAIKLLRSLHVKDPTNVFVVLRLMQALVRSNDKAGALALSNAVDLPSLVGPPEFIMAIAQQVSMNGHPERAYPVAYDLVRGNSENAGVVLGYAGLGMMLESNPMFEAASVSVGTHLSIKASDGQQQDFVIDDGGDFFGIRVLSPNSGIAPRFLGLTRGQTVELERPGVGSSLVWTVIEVRSKYLHLHHRVLEEFETRFPDNPGLVRFNAAEGNVDAVLDVIRRRAEQNANRVRLYRENSIPLAIAARGQGGGVVGFAQYIRQLGGQIVTCSGDKEELTNAVQLAKRHRGQGAVLDPYTAWVAADTGALPALKTFFGRLQTPSATIEMIERMLERAEEGRGKQQMTVEYRDGIFYRDEITDEFRDRQIAHFERVRKIIDENCDVVSVIMPDMLSENAELLLKVGGSRFLDAALLAADSKFVIISDDMRYRQIAKFAIGCNGVWLQAALAAACEMNQLSPSDYAGCVVGLATYGHGHLSVTSGLLFLIALKDESGLPNLKSVLTMFAGPNADMQSHMLVFEEFLEFLWPPTSFLPEPKAQAATGLGLSALLEHRKDDWIPILTAVISWCRGRPGLSSYMLGWLRGHFIRAEDLSPKTPTTSDARKKVRKRRW